MTTTADDYCQDYKPPTTMAELAEINCADCRWNTLYLGEWYMVRHEVWEQACRHEPKPAWEILCIGCLEERLGRTLTPDDFTDAPVNDPALPNTSSRLVARLSRRQSNAA